MNNPIIVDNSLMCFIGRLLSSGNPLCICNNPITCRRSMFYNIYNLPLTQSLHWPVVTTIFILAGSDNHRVAIIDAFEQEIIQLILEVRFV
jgi:hypothetical protein